MAQDWPDKTAQQLLNRDLIKTGICLLLGASDTGKIKRQAYIKV